MLDTAQARKYFEARLKGQLRGSGPEIRLRCPFHEDRSPSLSVNLDKGTWKCFAGCGEGGLIDFEMKFSSCDRETAKNRIGEVIGEPVFRGTGEQPEAIYQYRDAQGAVVFEKMRYPGKRFVQRKPNGKGGYDYKLGDISKPLYRLPELLVANQIVICEGEKDCDNVMRAFGEKASSQHLAATTNFDGAGKWNSRDSMFFAGKKVVILPDQDEIGRKHAQRVAESIYPYVVGIRVVELPGLEDHGDVSDYLKTHSADALIAEIRRAPQWRPATPTQKLFISAPAFVQQVPEQIDWLVEGVIERGANGFFSAVPKGGKSWAAVDLAISLALGCEWLDFRVARPVKVALVSREDNPSLTAWRIKHLFAGKTCPSPWILETNLYVNSRKQSAELMLDNSEQMTELLAALKILEAEFCIFDVFNVLHVADENDAQEMRTVLRQLSRIQSEIGCACAVVHHWNKSDQGSMTQRLRGSSAIAGWAEWLIGISMADEETKTRRMEFELKAAQSPEPVYYRIDSTESATRLSLSKAPNVPARRREGSAAERYMQ